MNFKIKSTNKEMVATTPKGNTIHYNIIPEDKLLFWTPTISLKEIDFTKEIAEEDINKYAEDLDKMRKATRIKVETSFYISMPMIDTLESSKILSVEYRKADVDNYLIITLQPLFSYDKFNDVLFDLVQKFGL